MNVHALNWYAGWWLLLAAFVTGAVLGMHFHHETFLGGYGSFRRRMLRLGHIALAALGILNLIFALGPCGSRAASACLVVGGVAMPAVCFLTGWRQRFRALFFLPVVTLLAAVTCTLWGGNDAETGQQPHSDATMRSRLWESTESLPQNGVSIRKDEMYF